MDNPPDFFDEMPPPEDDDLPPAREGKVVDFPGHVPDPVKPPTATAFDRATTREKDLHIVHTNRLDPFQIITAGWEAIFDSNKVPWIFRREGAIVRIGQSDKGIPKIDVCNTTFMHGTLMRTARWVKVTSKATSHVEPPRHVAADMVSTPSNRLPALDAIIRAPVFDAKGGTPRLVNARGYDAASHLYYLPPPGFVDPVVPLRPTDREIGEAVMLICRDWLGDFPFETRADRAHAVALMLNPLARRIYEGPSPLHLSEAAERGTGKGLLIKLCLTPSQGLLPEAITLPTVDEEIRKKITSILYEGSPYFFIDNLEGEINSADLAAVLTTTEWRDRILGSTATASLPNLATWAASGNNVQLSTDIARRTIRIRLNRKMERPWEWKGAKIKDIEQWTLRHRTELLRAALILIQAWITAGQPKSGARLGSFEGWAECIGGILAYVDIPDFLGNQSALYESADTGMTEWRAFVHRWYNECGLDKRSASNLAFIADENELLASVFGSQNNERGKAIRMGRALGKQRDRVISGLKITTGVVNNQAMFWLEMVDPALAPDRRPVTTPNRAPPDYPR